MNSFHWFGIQFKTCLIRSACLQTTSECFKICFHGFIKHPFIIDASYEDLLLITKPQILNTFYIPKYSIAISNNVLLIIRKVRELSVTDSLEMKPCMVFIALNEAHPHWLIGVAGLHRPFLPLAAEQLLSDALLDDGVGIWGRKISKTYPMFALVSY